MKRLSGARASFLTAVLVSTVLLSGCGGGDDGDETAAKSGLEKSKIVITQGGYVNEVISQRLPEIAKRHGLEIEIIKVRTGSDILTALLSGSADVTLLTFAHLFQSLDQGQDIVAIASNMKGGTRVLTGAGIKVAAGDFKALNDLAAERKAAGKPLVLAGDETSINYALGTGSLQENGIDLSNFKTENVVDPSLHAQLLARGAADVLVSSEPASAVAVVQGWGRTFHYPYDTDMASINTDWLAKRQFVKQNPKTIAALTAAIDETDRYIQEHPEEAVQSVTEFAGIDGAIAREALKNYTPSPTIDVAAAEALAKTLAEAGLVEKDWSAEVAGHVMQD